MTFVDVVFPAFLFIVGMAIPYAVQNRLKKGDSWGELWKHILIRTFGLLVLGVYMVNSGEMNSEASLIGKTLWDILFYSSVILIWNIYPRTEERSRKALYLSLQLLGAIILIILPFLFRKGPPEQLTGMTTSWWGILGLIGWASLFSLIVFSLFHRRLYAMIGMLGLFIILVVGLKNDLLSLPVYLEWIKGQSGNFAHASLTISGIILSLVLMEEKMFSSPSQKIRWMVVFGGLLLVAGYFLRPLYGISKIYATPTWALYSAAICCFLFPLIYWLVDVKGYRRWADFLKPAGQNPLLTYILPFIFGALFGYAFWPDMLSRGIPGIIRSLGFSLFILGVAALLTKGKIRLKL